MSDFETSAGATAPATGERRAAHDPRHAPAVVPPTWVALSESDPLTLTLEQSTRLRGRIDALVQLGDELGVRVSVSLRNLDEPTAWEVLPDGEHHEIAYESLYKGAYAFGVRKAWLGEHHVHDVEAYTGEIAEPSPEVAS
jgi:hypothetical protein